MELISQDGAMASLIFISDQVRPVKGFYLPRLLRAIAERYKTAKAASTEEARTSGAIFQDGTFDDGGRSIGIGTLRLFNDGIAAITTDTVDSDLVLDDLFAWLKQEFQFRDPSTPFIRVYQSDLVVKFDHDPASAFGLIQSFLDFIQGQGPPTAHPTKSVVFRNIAFSADPTVPGLTPEFTIERRTNVPWRLGLYFSKAHMQTKAHIRALEILDGLLGAAKS